MNPEIKKDVQWALVIVAGACLFLGTVIGLKVPKIRQAFQPKVLWDSNVAVFNVNGQAACLRTGFDEKQYVRWESVPCPQAPTQAAPDPKAAKPAPQTAAPKAPEHKPADKPAKDAKGGKAKK